MRLDDSVCSDSEDFSFEQDWSIPLPKLYEEVSDKKNICRTNHVRKETWTLRDGTYIQHPEEHKHLDLALGGIAIDTLAADPYNDEACTFDNLLKETDKRVMEFGVYMAETFHQWLVREQFNWSDNDKEIELCNHINNHLWQIW